VRVEEVVGRRVRARREELGMTQKEFGRRVGQLLGKAWSRSTVSVAENGSRAWAAADLVAVAMVLQVTVGDLLIPPIEEAAVDLGGPQAVPKSRLSDAVTAHGREDLNLAAIRETLSLLADTANRSQADGNRILEIARDLDVQITQRVAAGGVVSLPLGGAGVDPAPQHSREEEMQPVVAAIVTSPLGVLVGRRNDGKPPWTFIAGEVEPGERPEDAAVREVKEETGLLVRAGAVIGERVHPKTGRTMIYMSAAPTHGTDVFVGDADELAEVRWIGLAEADELLPGMFGPVREHLARELAEG